MEVQYLPKFLRQYQKIPKKVKIKAEKQEAIFRKNPFDPRLKTHHLIGKLKEFWSFSVDYQYRIIFQFADENIVWFYLIGTHSIYK
ncbi:MAG: type II toxin-antitoxin system mRNA interferase toxin, RelE/StbE family [Candidatus Shapirobacteria bacterium]|nr:type II toxin-antitoxin system mRNA interferase toxin, RelE/StbE family [Candidatus Shapirobacteria bacterium]